MIEIERKFLVKREAISDLSNCFDIVQGYIINNENGSVRVRIETEMGKLPKAFLMSKTKIDHMTNSETVDEISVENAKVMIKNFSFTVVEKTRCIRNVSGKKWEIDIFKRPNNGLLLAEIELKSVDENFELPDWIDKEVTGEAKYYNVNM